MEEFDGMASFGVAEIGCCRSLKNTCRRLRARPRCSRKGSVVARIAGKGTENHRLHVVQSVVRWRRTVCVRFADDFDVQVHTGDNTLT